MSSTTNPKQFWSEECEMDPFVNSTEDMTVCEWAKVILFTITGIAPLRCFGVVSCLASAWTASFLSTIGLPPGDSSPRIGWRRDLQQIVKICSRGLLFFFGFHTIKVSGEPDRSAPIVVCNHPSFFEPLYLTSVYLPVLVSKKENADLPFLGTVATALNAILVDRNCSESRKAASDRLKRIAHDPAHPPVVIFPEGTNTNGQALVTFKLGAFIAGLPVQPVVVRYHFRRFDPTAGSYSSMAWHVYRTLCQFENRMSVEFLPTVCPTTDDIANPSNYARRVRSLMSIALGVPTTGHSFVDVVCRRIAEKNGHSPTCGNVNYGELRRRNPDLNFDTVKNLATTYFEAPSSTGGMKSAEGLRAFILEHYSQAKSSE